MISLIILWIGTILFSVVIVWSVLLVVGARCLYIAQAGRCTSRKSMNGKTILITGASSGN